MKIIYSCYGGAHTSIAAAGIHLGYLPNTRIADAREINITPYFDQATTVNIGKPIYMGQDRFNHEVYVIGMGSCRKEGTRLLYQMVNDSRGKSKGEVVVVNSIALINLEIRIGGFLSRRLGLISLGRWLIIYGIRKKYTKFVQLVEEVKSRLRKNQL